MENTKLNVKWFMVFLPIVSIGGSMIITNWDGSGVSIFLDIVFWTFILGFLYFIVTALICAVFKVEIPDSRDYRDVEKARKMTMERAMWEEEDVKENRIKRKKAMRRIKKLQQEYPDMWELLVEPEDEYLCFDYINGKKKEKEQEESNSSGMIFGCSHSHSHSDSSGSDTSGF